MDGPPAAGLRRCLVKVRRLVSGRRVGRPLLLCRLAQWPLRALVIRQGKSSGRRPTVVGHRDFGYALAARASIWTRDRDGVAAAVSGHRAVDTRGAVIDAEGATLEAGLAALEGPRDAALAGHADALGRWRTLDLPVDRALCGIDMAAVLGPGEAAARAASDEARAVLESLGANASLERLDGALERLDGALAQPRGDAGRPARRAQETAAPA
jgi:hypothetical protein